MPTPTPQITLTASLQDFTGNAAGTTANPAKLLIALCGFGQQIPEITGFCTIGRTGPLEIVTTGGSVSTTLWGNDQITPSGTYYTITVLDGFGNVVQCAAYQFTGTQTIDLSSAQPIVNPSGGALPYLDTLPCSGAVPGSSYTAPGKVVAVFYGGILQRRYTSSSLPYDYTLTGPNTFTFNFTTETGYSVYALCVS